jgi:hypothetical protein
MEDFSIDLTTGKSQSVKTMRIPIPKFTLIGATTKAGSLSGPLRDRFGIIHRLEFYTPEELATIVKRTAKILEFDIDEEGAKIIAERSRCTPRIANRLVKRCADWAIVKGDGKISLCNTSGTEVGVISKDGFYYGVKPNTGFDHITTFEGTKIDASAGIILTGNRKVEIYEDELETNSMKILADAKGMDFWVNTSFAYRDKDYERRGMIKLVLDDEYDHTTHLRVQASGQLLLESSDVCFKATNVSVMSGSTEYHGYSGTISTGSKSLKFLKGLLVSAT